MNRGVTGGWGFYLLAILAVTEYNDRENPNIHTEVSADMEVKYRWKKHYKTAKYPIRQPRWLTWLIWMLSRCALIGKNYKLETVDMEGLEPPYLLFSNHMAFIDFGAI